jgi:hypothetical protein
MGGLGSLTRGAKLAKIGAGATHGNSGRGVASASPRKEIETKFLVIACDNQ